MKLIADQYCHVYSCIFEEPAILKHSHAGSSEFISIRDFQLMFLPIGNARLG